MKKLLSLLVLTGTLFAQANNVFTLNPSVNSSAMGNVGIAHADVKNVFHNPAFAGLNKRHQEISYFNYGTQIEANSGGIILGDFESSSYRVSGGYGFGIGDWLFGARLNLYNHNFIDSFDIKMNYGLDVGVHKQFNNTSLGIVLKDLGGETEFLDEKLDLPIGIEIPDEKITEALRNVAPEEWVQEEVEKILDDASINK